MRLLLIRHAESQGNREMRLQGRKEFPLTARGRRQAKCLAARFSQLPLVAVYASPIKRAADTADSIAAEAGLEAAWEPRLQEYDFGELLSGLTWAEIREKLPGLVEALASNSRDFPHYPGEEGREAFRRRISQVMWEIAGRHDDDGCVAVVTHAGPIAVFVLEALGRAYQRPLPFMIENASVTTLEFGGQALLGAPRAALVGLNDTCHLRED